MVHILSDTWCIFCLTDRAEPRDHPPIYIFCAALSRHSKKSTLAEPAEVVTAAPPRARAVVVAEAVVALPVEAEAAEAVVLVAAVVAAAGLRLLPAPLRVMLLARPKCLSGPLPCP